MTGDTARAVADFRAFLDGSFDPTEKARRRRWIAALRAGPNPFTRQELDELLRQ